MHVDVPNQELKTWPIFDDIEKALLSLDTVLESHSSYFNDGIYSIGQYVCSGNGLLRCKGRVI